jgi:uncharacterized membrane protein YccC
MSTALAKWKDRALGAAVGVPVGMLVGLLMPHESSLAPILTIVIALTLVAFNHYVVGFGVRCALQAIAIIVAGHTVLAADVRLINVIAGGSVGLVFTVGVHHFCQWQAKKSMGGIEHSCSAS